MALILFTLVIYFLSCFSFLALGRSLFLFGLSHLKPKQVSQSSNNQENRDVFLLEDYLFWSFGLLSHLWLTYLVYRLGLSAQISYLLILILSLAAFKSQNLQNFDRLLKSLKQIFLDGISYNFQFYFFVILALGLSVFWSQEGIKTLWVNNYGDLPFHLSMITNFAQSSSTLVEYPIYPGVNLSYYFFLDFWTACLYYESDSWTTLSIICLLQWLTAWLFIYASFSKVRSSFFSFLLLFGGGSYYIFFKQIFAQYRGIEVSQMLSHSFIDKGYPWTVFLTAIWIPQRASVFGLAILTPVFIYLSILFRNPKTKSTLVNVNQKDLTADIFMLPMLGLTSALSAMAHSYFAMIALLFIGGSLLLNSIFRKQGKLVCFREFILFLILSVITLIPSAYILYHKSEGIKFKWAWMPWTNELSAYISEAYTQNLFIGGLSMWLANASVMIILFILLLKRVRIHELLVLVAIFVILNVVQLTSWNWDNYKGFIALYALIVCLFSTYRRPTWFDSFGLFLLIIPGIYETSVIMSIKSIEIQSKESLYKAKVLADRTRDEPIAAKSDHNSPITLAGRKIFLGYPGWLGSHGINYGEREKFNNQITSNPTCELYKQLDAQIGYVYLSDSNTNLQDNKITSDPVIPGLYDLRTACR